MLGELSPTQAVRTIVNRTLFILNRTMPTSLKILVQLMTAQTSRPSENAFTALSCYQSSSHQSLHIPSLRHPHPPSLWLVSTRLQWFNLSATDLSQPHLINTIPLPPAHPRASRLLLTAAKHGKVRARTSRQGNAISPRQRFYSRNALG